MASMECLDYQDNIDQQSFNHLKIIRHPLYQLKSPPWFELRVFYVRVSNFHVDDSTPEYLMLNHIPLGPDTILEVNGGRSSAYSECVSTQLRRDRVDKNSDEATYVNTDSIRITGSVRFEVYDGDAFLLSGILELCNANGVIGDAKGRGKKWSIKCHANMPAAGNLLKEKQHMTPGMMLPTIEVYVAGSFSGNPIILTKTLHLGCPTKQPRKLILDSIPEYDSTETGKDFPVEALQTTHYTDYKSENGIDDAYKSLYARSDNMEEEGGELSWFNAGVRVGVGIGLGICVGVGLGVGLLVRSYQATSHNFRRRLL